MVETMESVETVESGSRYAALTLERNYNVAIGSGFGGLISTTLLKIRSSSPFSLPHGRPRDHMHNREQFILLGMNIAEIDLFTGIVTHFGILSKFTDLCKKLKINTCFRI